MPIARNVSAVARGQLYRYSHCSIAIPFVFIKSHCKAIKLYNFSTSDHHQRMVVVESNPVVWIRLKKLIREQNVSTIEVQSKLDQLKLLCTAVRLRQLAFEGQLIKDYTKLETSRNASKG